MFIALDKKNERISIENANNSQEYFCPICKEKLIIKAASSDNIRTYFSHIHKCEDDFDHDMSEWHWNWQQQFPEQNREIVVEKNGVKHRADVLINDTVIEFQHSQISSEEIKKRNDFYLSSGYNMVWVFDVDGKIKSIFNESIDPYVCLYDELCWKKKNLQFKEKMPPEVKVFFQYKTKLSIQKYSDTVFDILILMTEISDKYLSFYKTGNQYITPYNFLKEFGISKNNETMSISEILLKSKGK